VELLDWIYVDQIEPWMREMKNTFIFVESFPAGANSLAKVSDQGWSRRFELFYEGVEIANAFEELLDPHEHEVRWERIQSSRKVKGLKPLGKDSEFFACIRSGLPSCVGIALGLERLFMSLHGFKNLSEFKPFAKRMDELI
jgi:lysyl-tRNA synthetase class 2